MSDPFEQGALFELPRTVKSNRITLILGDNRHTLRTLADASIDAVVCDPPYGLGKEPDMVEVLRHWLVGDDWTATGPGGFMNAAWDSFVPGPATWREVHRVLKPGGHVCMFSGTRTFDMATLALRLAGFEIRDTLCWLYAQGFPKSMDVSKQIDKQAGAEREVIGSKLGLPGYHLHSGDGGMSGALGEGFNGQTDAHRIATAQITAPATDEAQTWDGWGTALKPGYEPIVLARKPVEGTVAANVLVHGTGALNIDASRISGAGEVIGPRSWSDPSKREGVVGGDLGFTSNDVETFQAAQAASVERANTLGRWPANVLLTHHQGCVQVWTVDVVESGGLFDGGTVNEVEAWECTEGCPIRLLDEQTGTLTSGDAVIGSGRDGLIRSNTYGSRPSKIQHVYADSGGASRFFYNGKVSGAERNAGMPRGTVNDHPTIKPVAVMEWLIGLITPPGGTVLDPYLGSGTTAVAATNLGFDVVGLEQHAPYLAIARHRIWHAGGDVELPQVPFDPPDDGERPPGSVLA